MQSSRNTAGMARRGNLEGTAMMAKQTFAIDLIKSPKEKVYHEEPCRLDGE